MLTARNVIAAVVAVAVISTVLATISLMRGPGTDGRGADSFGTRSHGLKAVHDILAELGVPVARSLVPPTDAASHQGTLVLWKPHQRLTQAEPVWLRQIAAQIRDGARVVVAPPWKETQLWFSGESTAALELDDLQPAYGTDRLLTELGLDGIVLNEIGGEKSDGLPNFREKLERRRSERDVELRTVPAVVHGDWPQASLPITKLCVPGSGLQILDDSSPRPDARISIRSQDGKEFFVAARYRRDSGELIVVSDPRLLTNRLISRDDNPVLAWMLLAAPGGPVVFDEFYHGLSIRGNPLYLFSRPVWGLTALCVLLLLGIWIWHHAIALGPPLPPRLPGRRTLGEYVDAMAALFGRLRSGREFLLREFRLGVLWKLRHELGLPPRRDDADDLIAALGRRDPERARELQEALGSVDALLSASTRPDERQIVRALQRMSRCL